MSMSTAEFLSRACRELNDLGKELVGMACRLRRMANDFREEAERESGARRKELLCTAEQLEKRAEVLGRAGRDLLMLSLNLGLTIINSILDFAIKTAGGGQA